MKIGPLPKGKLWFEYDNYQEHIRFLNLQEREKEIIEQFKKDGYYLFKNAIGEDIIETVNAALDGWIEKNKSALNASKKPDGTYPRLIALHEAVPAIEKLFSNEITLKLQDLLVGYRNSLYTSIAFLQGSQQPLHRDISVFHISPENFYFRIWFALENVTSESGPLMGVKGGHKVAVEKHKMRYKFYSRFDEIPEQDPLLWRNYQDILKQKYRQAGLIEEIFELSKGDLLIWHPFFPHGGSGIEDKALSRRAVVLHVSVT